MQLKTIIRSIILLVLTFIGLLVFYMIQSKNANNQPDSFPDAPIQIDQSDNPYASLFIPPFRLTNAQGEIIDDSILDGKYTVVDFFYTSCPLICPGMTAAMKKIQDETAGTDVQLLSISIDPEYDTPEVIKGYSEAYKADPNRWTFATGDPDMISIILAGVQFQLSSLKTDEGFRDIGHPATILLIGPDRHAIKLYRYSDPDDVALLIETAKKLSK